MLNYYDRLFVADETQYRLPYVDEYGELIRHHYEEPSDAIWEMLCNLYNSNVLSEDDLRADMAFLCHFYDLDDSLLYAEQSSIVGDIDVYGPLSMTWYAETRDAIRALRDMIFHKSSAYTREDLRGTFAYLCVHLGIDSDHLEEQKTA